MSTWLVPRSELTPDQVRVIERDMSEHRVVFGGPGSGKTQVLVHRARHLMDRHGLRPEDIQIFVFTGVLKEYISSALDMLDIPESRVSTFDAWCQHFHKEHIGRVPWDRGPDTEKIREAVWRLVKDAPSKYRRFPAVLVDEGQDLDAKCYEILRAVAGHITVCVDHKQQIYDHGCREDEILQALGMKRRNASLLETYRCSPYIVHLASRLIREAAERDAYVNQTRVSAERETPLLYVARDFDDERARLIDVIKMRQNKGERIAILLPQNRQVAGFAMGLKEAGLEVEVRGERWRQEELAGPLDFTSDLPKLLTYHSAKGLTFDSVLMPRLVPRSFEKVKSVDNMLFVGITRASKWVYLSTDQSRQLPVLSGLVSSKDTGCLTVQRFDDSRLTPRPEARTPGTPPPSDVLDIL
jgi:superfamily I DNA/RNA helicase